MVFNGITLYLKAQRSWVGQLSLSVAKKKKKKDEQRQEKLQQVDVQIGKL